MDSRTKLGFKNLKKSLPLFPNYDHILKFNNKLIPLFVEAATEYAQPATGIQHLRIPHARPEALRKIMAIKDALRHVKPPINDKNLEKMEKNYIIQRAMSISLPCYAFGNSS